MRREELEVIIGNLKVDINPEGSHLEIKRKWGDLKKREIKEELIKDLAALANTRGDGDRHLIVGLGKTKVQDAPLPTDESDIQQLLGSNVEPPIHFKVKEHIVENKTVTVLTIPKSVNRPHVVKEFKGRENCIFVRRGSTIAFANRAELNDMFAERYKDQVPDLRCEIVSQWTSYSQRGFLAYTIVGITLDILIFNKGDKRTTIKSLSALVDDKAPHPHIVIKNQYDQEIKLPIALDAGDGEEFTVYLNLGGIMNKDEARGSKEITLILEDIHGNECSDQKVVEIL